MSEMLNEYKSLSLFNDVNDPELRSHNRGAIMANLFEQNIDKNTLKVTTKGLALILGYFNSINPFDRRKAKEAFEGEIIKRGIKSAS